MDEIDRDQLVRRLAELERDNAALKRQIAELRGAVEVLLEPPKAVNE
jgi:cell division protein FtsB